MDIKHAKRAKFIRLIGCLWCIAVGGTLLVWAVLCTIFIPNSDWYSELMAPVYGGIVLYGVLIAPYFFFADMIAAGSEDKGYKSILVVATCLLLYGGMHWLEMFRGMAYQRLLPEIRYNILVHNSKE